MGYAVPLVALRKARVNVNEVFAGNQEGAMAQLKARRVDAAAVNSRFPRPVRRARGPEISGDLRLGGIPRSQ